MWMPRLGKTGERWANVVLHVLVVAFVLLDGSFRGELFVVDECPKPEEFIEKMEQKLLDGNFAGWSARCMEFEFVPVDLETRSKT